MLAALVAIAAGIVIAGILAVGLRPVAPPVGPLPDASTWFDAALLDRIAAYRRPVYVLVPVATVAGALAPLIIVTRPRVRRVLQRHAETLETMPSGMARRTPSRAVVVRAAAVALAVLMLQDLVLLPFRWWLSFVHAGTYGLRTQGVGGWAVDQALASGVGWVGTTSTVAVVVWLVWRLPRAWPFAVGVVLSGLTAVVLVAWPLVVEPLRFDFVELAEGPTRTAVEEVTDEAGLGEAAILVADASRRTTRRNAYVSGYGATRRIVLYDTLVELPDEQVAAVVAHEVAHHLNHDLLRGWLAGAAAAVGTSIIAGAIIARRRVHMRRLVANPYRIAQLVAIALLVEALVLPVSSWMSRRAEAAADATALELTVEPDAFAALQRSLVTANLSDPSPPDWWVWWRGTHPPPASRIHRALTFRP